MTLLSLLSHRALRTAGPGAWLAGLVALLLAAPALAQKPKAPAGFEGRVVRVIDGATLVVRQADKTEQTVRLRNIDPPEPCQPGGPASKQALIDLALGNVVQVQAPARGAAGSVVAGVMLGDADLSRRQVEEGQAWSVRTRYDRGPLVKEERMATALKRGLHGAGGAVPPWEFRRTNGPCPG